MLNSSCTCVYIECVWRVLVYLRKRKAVFDFIDSIKVKDRCELVTYRQLKTLKVINDLLLNSST